MSLESIKNQTVEYFNQASTFVADKAAQFKSQYPALEKVDAKVALVVSSLFSLLFYPPGWTILGVLTAYFAADKVDALCKDVIRFSNEAACESKIAAVAIGTLALYSASSWLVPLVLGISSGATLASMNVSTAHPTEK